MMEAHSLQSIVQAADQQLGEEEVDIPFEPPSLNTDLFIPGSPFAGAAGGGAITVVTEQWSKLIGILFCQPGTKLAREEIIPNLDYFYYRSGVFVDFFCAGYSAQWDASSSQHHEPEAIVRGVPPKGSWAVDSVVTVTGLLSWDSAPSALTARTV